MSFGAILQHLVVKILSKYIYLNAIGFPALKLAERAACNGLCSSYVTVMTSFNFRTSAMVVLWTQLNLWHSISERPNSLV